VCEMCVSADRCLSEVCVPHFLCLFRRGVVDISYITMH
jgi:hypothetical protein